MFQTRSTTPGVDRLSEHSQALPCALTHAVATAHRTGLSLIRVHGFPQTFLSYNLVLLHFTFILSFLWCYSGQLQFLGPQLYDPQFTSPSLLSSSPSLHYSQTGTRRDPLGISLLT